MGIPFMVYNVHEPRGGECVRTSKPIQTTFDMLCAKPVVLIVIFSLGIDIFKNLTTPADSYVAVYWVEVNNFQQTFVMMLQHLLFGIGFALMLRYFLNANWRLMIGLPMVGA